MVFRTISTQTITRPTLLAATAPKPARSPAAARLSLYLLLPSPRFLRSHPSCDFAKEWPSRSHGEGEADAGVRCPPPRPALFQGVGPPLLPQAAAPLDDDPPELLFLLGSPPAPMFSPSLSMLSSDAASYWFFLVAGARAPELAPPPHGAHRGAARGRRERAAIRC